MSGSFLGAKKIRKIEQMLGVGVEMAHTRDHFWATVKTKVGLAFEFNYKDGRIIIDAGVLNRIKQKAFDETWNSGVNDLAECRKVAEEVEAKTIAGWTESTKAKLRELA
jgi:hypothetical protein